MSVITGLGKGLGEPASPFRQAYFFGAALNSVNADGWNAIPIVVDPTTSFDLSNILGNHEVVVALLGITGYPGGASQFTFKWYRNRDNALLYQYTGSFSAAVGGWVYSYSYIGYIPSEINENGGYHVDISVTGALSYTTKLSFDVTGITALPPPPVLPFNPMDAIFAQVWSVSDYVLNAYNVIKGWVWPFSLLQFPVYFVWLGIWGLLTPIANFGDWVVNVATLVSNILNWDNIKDLILGWIPDLEGTVSWFQDRWSWFRTLIGIWWLEVSTLVQGWIGIAKQAVLDIVANVSTMVTNLQTAWDDFQTITLPTLATNLSVTSLIATALKTAFPFFDDLVTLWNTIALFFTTPFDWLLDKFTDWFLGPEV